MNKQQISCDYFPTNKWNFFPYSLFCLKDSKEKMKNDEKSLKIL